MSDERTAWHVLFAAMITERAPPGFEIMSEHRLTLEPQRADFLFKRSGEVHDEEARTLKRLWPWLGKVTLGEFKSISKPFRVGDLARLMGYAWQYRAKHGDKLRPEELTLLLVVPNVSASLQAELASNGWKMDPLGDGYHRVDTGVYWLYVAVIDEVAQTERDALLSMFGPHPQPNVEAQRWFERFVMAADDKKGKEMEEMEGYDELEERFVERLSLRARLKGLTPEQRLEGLAPEQRLEGLAPEQRLEGLAPEQRLEGLAPEQQVLALSDEVLRGLSDNYLDSLTPATREAIRRRIGR